MSAVLDVIVSVNKDGSVEIDKVKRSADQAEKSTDKLTKSTDKMSKSFASTAIKVALVGTALYGVVKAFNAVVSSGLDYNKQMDASQAKLTAMISASKSYETISGRQVDALERQAMISGEVAEMMEILKTVNTETAMGMSELIDIYSLAKPGMDRYKWAVEDQIEIVKLASNTASNFGMSAQELSTGIDDLATGTWLASSGFGKMMKALGVSKDEFKETGDKVAYLKEKMKETGAVQDTWAVATSNFKVAWDNMAGSITQPIFDGIKNAIKDVTGLMGKTAPSALQIFSNVLVDMVNGSVKALSTLVSWISKVVSGFRIAIAGYQKLAGATKVWWNGTQSENIARLAELEAEKKRLKEAGEAYGVVRRQIQAIKRDMKDSAEGREMWINADKDLENIAEFDASVQNVADTIGKIDIKYGVVEQIKEATTQTDKLAYKINNITGDVKKPKKKKKTQAEKDAEKAIKNYDKAIDKLDSDLQNVGDNFAGTIAGAFGTVGDEMYRFYETVSQLMADATAQSVAESQATGAQSTGPAVAKAGSQAGIYGAIAMAGLLAMFGMASGGTFDSEEVAPELGDNAKTSDTLENALDNILDVQYPMLEVSREMAGYLLTISKAFGGIENSLIRSGIDIGGSLFQDTYKKGTLFGGKSTSLYGTSIEVESATMAELINGEITAMLDTVTKTVKKSWYGSKKTSYSHKYTDISEDIGSYVSEATLAIFDSLTASADALGLSTIIEEEVEVWVKDAETATTTGFTSFFRRFNFGSTFGRLFGRTAEAEAGHFETQTITKSLQDEIIDIGKFDTTGMSADEVSAEIQSRFSAQVDAITEKYFGAVAEFQKAGEGLGETLFRVVTNFDQVGHSLGLIDKSVDWRTATIIADVAGGLDKLGASMSNYTENFFSAEEQYNMKLATMSANFSSLGVAMPTSNKEFRALIEGIDTTTDAGATLFAEVISLSGAFAEMTDASQDLGKATKGYIDDISGFLTGQYSFLTSQGKTDYANMMLEQSKGENPLLNEVDASRLRLEQAYLSVSSQEEFEAISKQHLEVLVENAEKDATNADLLGELVMIKDKLTDIEEIERRLLV